MEDLSIKVPLYAALLAVAAPMAALLYLALSSGGLAAAFSSAEFLESLGVTFLGASIATAANVVLGSPAAYALARGLVRGEGAIYDLLLSPISIPHTVVGIMLLLIFSPYSPLYFLLGALNPLDTLWGMSLAMFYVSLPIYVMSMRERFEKADREAEVFLMSLGNSPSRVFYSAVLRGSYGSVLRVSLLSLGRAISEFGSLAILSYAVTVAPFFYYVKPVTIFIWYKYEEYGLGAVVGYSSALLLITLAVTLAVYVAGGREGHIKSPGGPAAGKRRSPRPVPAALLR